MWLLKQGLADRFERARGTLKFTAEDEKRFKEEGEPASTVQAALPRIARTAGSVMQIDVEGVLTKKRDFWAWLFYGANTAYRDIQAALALAAQDSAIKSVVLNIDSPGGSVDGLFDLLGDLQAFSKKVEVQASLAASAAYAIAAVAPGKITATNIAAEFGSVGVVASYLVDEMVVDITSTDAPNKRPDLTTEEGQAVVREELDAIHQIFVEAIANGRGTTIEDVNANFGRGSVLLAKEAKRRGMIDSVAMPPSAAPRKASAEAEVPRKKKPMNEEELKAQHPELYAALLDKGRRSAEGAIEEARAAGVATERKRVLAHLKLADTTGATKVARDAIESGASTMDEGVFADYQAAAFKRSAVTDRDADAATAAAAVNGAAPAKDAPDLQDQIVATLDSKKGVLK